MRTSEHIRIGILADDLTSAADGAGPFVARRLRAAIGRGAKPEEDCAVLSVDSGSRSMCEREAAGKVAALTRQIADRAILYKTVDSTLRGHVTAELEAAFGESRRKMLVFAPAFPDAGRTTVGGVQLVDGVPVSQTVYGRDPVHPARTSLLRDLIPASISNVVMLDAITQTEINSQIAALPDPEDILWVGSPGMAEALARRVMGARRVANVSEQPAKAITAQGDILVAVGTANPRSRRQARQLEGMEGVTLLCCPLERKTDPHAVLAELTDDAAMRLRSGAFGALIATGGDTMEAILDRLSIREFEVLDEMEPGFPLGRVTLGKDRPLLIAMKAGGFGDDATLRRAVARLQRTFLPEEQEQP